MAALKRHVECRHNNIQESYSCANCQTVFKTKWSLSTHNSRYHRNKSEVRNTWTATPPVQHLAISQAQQFCMKVKSEDPNV